MTVEEKRIASLRAAAARSRERLAKILSEPDCAWEMGADGKVRWKKGRMPLQVKKTMN